MPRNSRPIIEPASDPSASTEALQRTRVPPEALQRTRRMLAQIDLEARSTRKTSPHGHPKFYYGYKGHIGVDTTSTLIRRTVVTSANRQDVDLYPELLAGDERAIYGDKAYLKESPPPSRGATGSALPCLIQEGPLSSRTDRRGAAL